MTPEHEALWRTQASTAALMGYRDIPFALAYRAHEAVLAARLRYERLAGVPRIRERLARARSKR